MYENNKHNSYPLSSINPFDTLAGVFCIVLNCQVMYEFRLDVKNQIIYNAH